MNQHILIVEDNPANSELLCDWLESEGYQVAIAENLAQSHAAMEKHAPAIVLLDVQLGREDGLDLVPWVRAQEKLRDVPVVAVTAHAMVTDQRRVIDAGCNACLSKPIDFKALQQCLDHFLTTSPA
jgi:two-component system cell cycle response regulator DivK